MRRRRRRTASAASPAFPHMFLEPAIEALMRHPGHLTDAEASTSAPQYELRVRARGPASSENEVRQLPAPTTPQITAALRGVRWGACS